MSTALLIKSALTVIPKNPVKTVTAIGAMRMFPTVFTPCSKQPPTLPRVSIGYWVLALLLPNSHDGTLRNLRSIARDSVPKDTTAYVSWDPGCETTLSTDQYFNCHRSIAFRRGLLTFSPPGIGIRANVDRGGSGLTGERILSVYDQSPCCAVNHSYIQRKENNNG
jgi:hypothetical protein